MAYNPTMIPGGWEGGEKFSLRTAEQFNQNFNTSYNNALNRKEQARQFDAKKASAVEAEAKRLVKVMGLAKQLEQISAVEAPSEDAIQRGMLDQPSTSEIPTWEKRTKDVAGFLKNNAWAVFDKDTAPLIKGWVDTQNKISGMEMTAAKTLKALDANAEADRLAASSISAFRSEARELGIIPAEINAVIAANKMPSQDDWDLLASAKTKDLDVKAKLKADAEAAKISRQDTLRKEINTRNEGVSKRKEDREDKAKIAKAKAALAAAEAMPVKIQTKTMNAKGETTSSIRDNPERASAIAKAKTEVEMLDTAKATNFDSIEDAAKAGHKSGDVIKLWNPAKNKYQDFRIE